MGRGKGEKVSTMPWKRALSWYRVTELIIIHMRRNGEAIGLSTIRNPSRRALPGGAPGTIEELGGGTARFVCRR